MATESWECVEESAPHSESEDACGSTVSYAYSVCGSASEGSKHPSVVPNSDRIYINMVERMKQRKQRRRELEMQYEIARKQKEVLDNSLIVTLFSQPLTFKAFLLSLYTVE